MYNLEQLRWSYKMYVLARLCPYNLLTEPTDSKREHIGPTLTPPCDVIDDIITMA